MATEHTTVHATVHTWDQSAKKVSILNRVFKWPTILRNCLPSPPLPIFSGPFWEVEAYENRTQGSLLSIGPDISTFCREFIASNF